MEFRSWKDYQVDIPEGQSGPWKVGKATADDPIRLMIANMHDPGRSIAPGTAYTELTRHGTIIMSDTPAEIRDLYGFFHEIEYQKTVDHAPTVLMHGLGLGVALNGAFLNGAGHITVIEKSSDVIALTGKFWQEKHGDFLTIIEGDAYTWEPEKGQKWDVVWHDIWDNLCTDNLKSMTKLHRRFGRRCQWQESWGRKLLQRKLRAEKKAEHRWRW